MKEIIIHTKKWIEFMIDGGKFSGHDYFAGFPQPYKKDLNPDSIDRLYYALELIYKYDTKLDFSYYDFIDDSSLKQTPWRMDKMLLTWNLYNSLRAINNEINK